MLPISLLTLFLTLIQITQATTYYTPNTFPNPQVDINKCGRHGVQSHICDPDTILSTTSANKIEELIITIQDKYKSPCGGFQIAVAVLNQMEPTWPSKDMDRQTAASHFAKQLHDTWQVGNAKCQDGILLFLSRKDRSFYISTGSGAKEYLTNRGVETVLQSMTPQLKQDNVGLAVEIAVNKIAKEISSGRRTNVDATGKTTTSTENYLTTALAWIICIGIVLMFFSKSCSRHDEYAEVKRKLKRLDRERALARSQNFDQTSCPICFEEFTRSNSNDTDVPVAGVPVAEETEDRRRVEQLPVAEVSPVQQEQEEQRAPDLLRCGHKFCRECLNEWLLRSETCPICRQPAKKVGSSERDMRDGPPPGTDSTSTDSNDRTDRNDRDDKSNSTNDKNKKNATRLDHEYKQCEAELPSHSTTGTESHSRATRRGGRTTSTTHTRTGFQGHQFNRHRPYDGLEIAFRLASLRRMHPNYINQNDVNRWSSSSFHDNMHTDSTFIQRNNPTSYSRNAGTGSRGFSSSRGGSFGGGSSQGGGGGGGGW